MKVERDFWSDRASGIDTYEWRVVVDGVPLTVREAVQPHGCEPRQPREYLERRAQQRILDERGKRIFGSRFR